MEIGKHMAIWGNAWSFCGEGSEEDVCHENFNE